MDDYWTDEPHVVSNYRLSADESDEEDDPERNAQTLRMIESNDHDGVTDLEIRLYGDDTVTTWANALANNTTLTSLVLDQGNPNRRSSSITTAGWITFFNVMCNSNSVLETIDVSECLLGDEGTSALVNALASINT